MLAQSIGEYLGDRDPTVAARLRSHDVVLTLHERVFRAVWDLEGALPDGGLFDYLSRPGDIDLTEIVSA